jgi:gliding motility-associated-like protein
MRTGRNSVGGALTYDWNIEPFGGSVSEQLGVLLFPSAPCDSILYNISLTSSNICGGSQYIDTLIVYALPQPTIELAEDSICSGETSTAFNTTDCAWETTYEWTLGDNPPFVSTSLEVTEAFLSEYDFGIYPLTLSASNACGIVDTTLNLVVVPNEIEALISADPIVGCEPLLVWFDQQMYGVTYFSWDFGDGLTSLLEDPSHEYPMDGTYEAMFIAGNFCGALDTTYQEIEVMPAPDFGVSLSDQFLCVGEYVTFDVFGDPINSLSWDFGDGTTSTLDQPNHVYNADGEFTITITANSSENGCPNSVTETIDVISTPTAIINADALAGCPPLIVSFSNNSEDAIDYYWTLGDGDFFIGDTLSHSYFETGTYEVEVVAINSNSCTDTALVEIVVYPSPDAAFTHESFNEYSELDVYFTNLSIGASAFHWHFGDGDISFLPEPSHSYSKTKDCSFFPELIAYNNFGCSDTAIKIINLVHELEVYTPNTFTPNNDRLNDIFQVVTSDVDPNTSRLTIFNRWGVLIYEELGGNPSWNGFIDGEQAPNDLYTWQYKGILKCGYEEVHYTGHVTLVR